MAVEMDGHDRFGSRRDLATDFFGINVEGVNIIIDEHRLGVAVTNGIGAGNIGQARNYDFIVRLRPQRARAQMQRGGAIICCDRMFHTAISPQTPFELGNESGRLTKSSWC